MKLRRLIALPASFPTVFNAITKGFGLLESGSVSSKNEVSIMVKNAVDVIFGGLSYWMFGFGLSFGEHRLSNPFCGWGHFFVAVNAQDFGWVYSKFFFQASFATTATTIVSGAMAERTKLEAYIVFSFVNTFVFCIPAHWVWAKDGWLAVMGVIDIAGAGPVHLVGGVTGLVATLMLKPRHNRFKTRSVTAMGSPSNAILGMFMLWSAVATICSSFAGGLVGLSISYFTKRKQFDVPCLINGVLSALVSVTGLCALAEPWEALIIGSVGAVLCLASIHLLDILYIDDPVGCVGVHAVGGIWSLIAGGFLTSEEVINIQLFNDNVAHYGLLKGGGSHLLGIQTLAAVIITLWTMVTSYLLLKVIDLVIGLRVSPEHEALGADLVEHGVGSGECSYDKVTHQITWHRVPIKMGHTCDACDLMQTHQCTEERPPGGVGTEEDRTAAEPARLLRHIERREAKSVQMLTHGLGQTESERIQAYRSRQNGRKGRTLGKRFGGKRNWSSLRLSMEKRIRLSSEKKAGVETNSVGRGEGHSSEARARGIASVNDTTTTGGFVLSNITIEGNNL